MQRGKKKTGCARCSGRRKVTVTRRKTHRRRAPSVARHATRMVGTVATASMAKTAIAAIK